MKRFLLAFLATLAMLPATGTAAVQVDPALEPYLRQPVPNQQLTVIALFEDSLPAPAARRSTDAYGTVRKYLMRNAQQSQQPAIRAIRQSREQFGAIQNFRPLWIANAMIIRTHSAGIASLVHLPRLKALYADREFRLIEPVRVRVLDRKTFADKFTYGLEKLNIPAVRKEMPNINGEGVTVGVLDTGIDAAHPDLAGKLKGFRDFFGKKTTPYDDHGHGTHVSGTIAGGETSNTEIGVAPKASLFSGKIFNAAGSSTLAVILQGMQWMADPDENPSTQDHPALVSNSWGGGSPSSSEDPKDNVLCKAVDGWVKLGILPVFANGNEGPRPSTVGVPAACPGSFGVGATDSKDGIARFSSRGPAIWSTHEALKPEVSAPGVDVLSAMPGGKYGTMSGTSMATPHAAGVAALLFQANPKFMVQDVATILMKSSSDLGKEGHDNDFGMGRLDALKALKPALRR
ncbi:MAG: S8 family serine peptidase [Bdellovibrionaceae bacterium]|nr:S8 family serine peptidase [Pseudobdellovibrionaceae bacterium]